MNPYQFESLSDFEMAFQADKVHIHRWPQDSPKWSKSVQKHLVDTVNQNLEKKKIILYQKSVTIQDVEFTSLNNIGISVPFFKDECRMIFEAKFDGLDAHVHLTIKSDFLDIFNQLMAWKRDRFSDN